MENKQLGTVHVSVLLRILKQVKTLEKLVVWSLDMDVDITSQEKHTGINAHSSLGFLNKSVKSFSVFDYKKTDADYCIGLNMLNLVLCLPRLQRLTSAEMVIESIKKYTEYCQLNKAIGCDCNIHLGKVEFIKT
ncbi:hypothetical protein GGF39_000678 [Coemansia sp. RSA 1721]|nr:hypothetical protein GGF39_000678 [Coemansia sp. RSA 1721]